MYIACYRGHDKVVKVFLDHGVQVDVPDKVSDILCICVKLYKYWHLQVLDIMDVYLMAITLATWEIDKTVSVYCHYSALVEIC